MNRPQLLRWLEQRDWDEGTTLMVLGAVVGLVGGLSVVGFYELVDLSYLVFIQWPTRHFVRVAHFVYLPLLTATGLLAAWWVVRRARLPEGQNVPDVQVAVAKRGGIIRAWPTIVRTVASAFTLGSGGSAGSEGPVAVLGSQVGSTLGRRLRLQPRHVKILVGCGAASGIAGAFNAPFAGAFFALEEVLGSFSVGAFSPVVIASVVGALTARPWLGHHTLLRLAPVVETHPIGAALVYPALGVACGLVSALYVRLYLAAPRLARSVPGPTWLQPVVGGLLVGGIVAASRGLLAGNGHLALPAALFGGAAWYLLVALSLAKVLATVITLAFGGSGGVFTPTLFIGAALGGGLGVLGAHVFPPQLVNPAAWTIVGMAGLVAGATRAPLTAIFMAFELTDDYGYVVPLMIVAVIAYATSRRFSRYGLYDGWLAERGEHLAHGVDQAVMSHLLVRDAAERGGPTVRPEARLSEVLAAASAARHGVVAVVEGGGHLVGVISQQSLRDALSSGDMLASMLVAEDLAESVPALNPVQTLREALKAMNARGLDALPVVREGTMGPQFIGFLSRSGVLVAYERELAHAV